MKRIFLFILTNFAVMAVLLAEYANDVRLDMARVIRLVLVHDLVEIDAGDTYCYDTQGNVDKPEREARAADRIFGLLPADQAAEFRALWEEFEARQTPEARFAAALDRLMPLMHNYFSGGKTWQEHGVAADRVFERNRHIAEGSVDLWAFAESLIKSAVENDFLEPGHAAPNP